MRACNEKKQKKARTDFQLQSRLAESREGLPLVEVPSLPTFGGLEILLFGLEFGKLHTVEYSTRSESECANARLKLF